MQFFAHGRTWDTEMAELIATTAFHECHVDTVPDWQRKRYYRTADRMYFYVTDVEERPGWLARRFGARVKGAERFGIVMEEHAVASALRWDLGDTPETTALIRRHVLRIT